MSFSRRIAAKNLGVGDSATDNAVNELVSRLQGIDQAKAEAFGGEGVTTVMQLAYTDPVLLSMRTNFEFSYTLDCISQALLWIYLEDDLASLRKFSLRGEQEAASLIDDLGSPDTAERANALVLAQQCADVLKMKLESLRQVLIQVAEDPYTMFICALWEEIWRANVAEALPQRPGPAANTPARPLNRGLLRLHRDLSDLLDRILGLASDATLCGQGMIASSQELSFDIAAIGGVLYAAVTPNLAALLNATQVAVAQVNSFLTRETDADFDPAIGLLKALDDTVRTARGF
jgi:hypothetical protein